MSENRALFFEEAVKIAVRSAIAEEAEAVGEEMGLFVPRIEFGNYTGFDAVNAEILITHCERTEKERVIRISAYAIEINIPVPDGPHDGEALMYAYTMAINRAIGNNRNLCGTVDNANLTETRIARPRKRHVGDCWLLTAKLRATVETKA